MSKKIEEAIWAVHALVEDSEKSGNLGEVSLIAKSLASLAIATQMRHTMCLLLGAGMSIDSPEVMSQVQGEEMHLNMISALMMEAAKEERRVKESRG
jgi:hypothetical protein